ncbi:MAG TPA: hypothetical protein VFR24_07230 [Candidatus Angelobacter sp.]|nr:hypothetical protein [Candidatus Angelobacter sp.]
MANNYKRVKSTIKGLSVESIPRDLPLDQDMLARNMIGFLDDMSAAPEDVRSCLDGLNEHGLRPFNYHYYYLNLLSIFGQQKSPAEIRNLAIACIRFRLWRQWESHVDGLELHRRKDTGADLPMRLKGWNRKELDSLLADRRGMIIATCHYGASCYLLDDLTSMGYHVVIGLDSNSAFGLRKRFELLLQKDMLGDQAQALVPLAHGSVRIIDVENNPFAAVLLAQTLRRNHIVLLYFDGNSGFDGARGHTNKSPLECLGYPVQVKSGVAQLALSTKAPLVPIFCSKTASLLDSDQPWERGVIYDMVPILPEAAVGYGEAFVSSTLQCLFDRMGALVMAQPEQWEGACLFHRWRALNSSDSKTVQKNPSALQMESILEGSRSRVKINHRLIATIPSSDGFMLVNVKTLQVFKINSKHNSILSILAGEGMESGVLHCDQSGSTEEMSCLKALSDLGFLESVTDGQTV